MGFCAFGYTYWVDCVALQDRVVAAKRAGVSMLVCNMPTERALWIGSTSSIFWLLAALNSIGSTRHHVGCNRIANTPTRSNSP